MIPEMAKHAEIFFYVFRDQIVAQKLEGVSLAALNNTAEAELGKVSGIYAGDIVLKEKDFDNSLTQDEWLELVPLLEIDFEAPNAEESASWEAV